MFLERPYKRFNSRVRKFIKLSPFVCLLGLFPLFSLPALALTSGEHAQISTISTKSLSKQTQKEWRLRLGTSFLSSETDSASYAKGRLDLRGELNLRKGFDIIGEIGFSVNSGFEQNRFGNDELGNGLSSNLLKVKFTPIAERLSLSAGILKQDYLGEGGLLVSSHRGFPGINQKVILPLGAQFSLQLHAEQNIPTTRSIDTDKRQEKEKTPLFFTESITLKYHPHEQLESRLQVTQFQFKNLPSSVAYEARKFGNTVPASQPVNAEFAFDFKGLLYHANMAYTFQNFKTEFFADFLENRSAPESFNRGLYWGPKLTWFFRENSLDLTYFNFFNESDSSISVFNNSNLGNNNRKGSGLELGFTYDNFLRLSTSYVDSDIINEDMVSVKQRGLEFMIETLYLEF